MKGKILLYLTFNLAALHLVAQPTLWENETKENLLQVYEQMRLWQENHANYSITVTHASFENYSTTIPYEKSTGYFRKAGLIYHSFLLGIHTIQNERYKIVLDTVNLTMMVANSDHNIGANFTIEDYGYMLNSCSGIKARNVGSDTRYLLQYPEGYPLDHFEMLVTNEGFLKEMILYYSTAVSKDIDNENAEKSKPRLSITFSDFRTYNPTLSGDEFDTANYFIVNGNKLIPTGLYTAFTLSDQRLTLN